MSFYPNNKNKFNIWTLCPKTNSYIKIIKDDFTNDIEMVKTRDELSGINSLISGDEKALKKPKGVIYADYFFYSKMLH